MGVYLKKLKPRNYSLKTIKSYLNDVTDIYSAKPCQKKRPVLNLKYN